MIAEVEAGDVPARESAVCSHGREGFCYDDALPAERDAIAFVHEHSFAWALAHTGDREVAERYAEWSVAESWHPGAVLLGGSHGRDFERFSASR